MATRAQRQQDTATEDTGGVLSPPPPQIGEPEPVPDVPAPTLDPAGQASAGLVVQPASQLDEQAADRGDGTDPLEQATGGAELGLQREA